jgi:purine-binding chemotaxis protein CheW
MQQAEKSTATPQAARGGAAVPVSEFLTFALDHETFAIPVESVREVVDPPPATAVPNAPDFAPGLINVRGNVVPLVDLRRRFAMPPSDAQGTRVVVAEVPVAGEPTLVGIMADAVYEVIDASRAAIEDIPRLGTRWRAEFIKGVAKQERGFVIILDMERILADREPARRSASQSE